jgi:hypothetical protein
MPDFRFEAIGILVILLPGFFAARLEQRLTTNPKQSEFDKTIEALLYSFFIYLIFTAITRSFPVSIVVAKSDQEAHYSLQANLPHLALLPVIAVALAWMVSFGANNDLFGRFFRWVGATRRTWRVSIWSDVFHNYGGVVQVELADGRYVVGWLKYYSDSEEGASLFLERAAWVGLDTKLIPIDGPGILVTSSSGIRSVMFLKAEEKTPKPEGP